MRIANREILGRIKSQIQYISDITADGWMDEGQWTVNLLSTPSLPGGFSPPKAVIRIPPKPTWLSSNICLFSKRG